MKTITYTFIGALIFSLFFFAATVAVAGDSKLLTYSGRILKPDTTPVDGNVTFSVQIFSPNSSKCLLWSEQQVVNVSNGVFTLEIGQAANRTAGQSSIDLVFQNSGIFSSLTCESGSTYTPSANDDRQMVVSFNDGSGAQTLSAMNIKSVPYALYADKAGEASKVGGAEISATAPTNGQALIYNSTSTKWEPTTLGGGTGTVTSITAGTGLTGGTISTNGTIAVNVGTAANQIPQLDGSAKIPVALIPNLPVNQISNGAGLYFTYQPNNTACATNEFLKWDGSKWICGTAGIGSVTSVTASSPLQSSGGTTPDISFSSQSANTVLAGPNGSAGAPSFRALVATDVPNLAASKITSGLTANRVLVANGAGTAISADACTAGQVMRFDGTSWQCEGGNAANQHAKLDAGGKIPASLLPSAYVDGSGTAGYIPKFSAGSTLANSSIYVDGSGNLGVGTATPSTLLHVNGVTTISGNLISSPLGQASAIANQNSNIQTFVGSYWNGSSSDTASITVQNVLEAGTDPSFTLAFQKVGGPPGDVRYGFLGGAVGIGTLAPSADLEIRSSYSNIMITDQDHDSTSNNASTWLSFAANDDELLGTLGFFVSPSMNMRMSSGLNRGIDFVTNDSLNVAVAISTAGNLGIGTTSPSARLDVRQTETSTSGTFAIAKIAPTYNQASGTASNTDLLINRTETAVGSGEQNLIDAQVGGVSKFRVDSTGKVYGDGSQLTGVVATAGSLGAGSGASPSLTFSADSNTGFYNPAADTIGVSANGSNIFNFSASGIVSTTNGGGVVTTENGTAAAPTFSFAGDMDTGWFSPAANTLAAATGGAERVRIDSAGNIGIGTTSPDERFVVYNGSTTGKYTTSGWTHSSDMRLKHDIAPIENSLDKIIKIQGVEYKFNSDPENKTQVGFIAQQVEPIFPEVVQTDSNGFKSMVYSNLVAPIVEAIKELYYSKADVRRVEKLEAENAELRARLERLEKAIGAK